MTSRISNLLAKANSVNLDEALKKAAAAPQQAQPRTAPGQLIGLQAEHRQALDRIKALEDQLVANAAGQEVELPLSEIYIVPGRKRFLTPDQRAELKANLAQHPLLYPVIVLPKNERGHELWAGHNRFEIYGELGKPTIKAIISAVEPAKIELYAFLTNLLAPSLTDYEKFLRFKKRKEATGMAQQQLADETGLSRQHVSKIFSFGDLPEEALALIEQNPVRLGMNAADELASAARAGRKDQVIEAVRMLIVDPKFSQKEAIALANKKPAAPRAAGQKPEPVVLRVGRTKFGELQSRNGIIALKLSDAELIGEWAKKIEDFVRSELEKAKE
ncbi:MAG: parB [Noviherbaspirillum sp.]|nr:parB [Noviherbaspirillum sp.]